MTDIARTEELFFERTGLSKDTAAEITAEACRDGDDGELFLEYRQSETIALDDGRIKSASFDTDQGWGLRSVSGEATGFAHAAEISEEALKRGVETVRSVHTGQGATPAPGPVGTNQSLYTDANPLSLVPFDKKVALLTEMDAYARGLDARVAQVSASLGGSWQAVHIIRPDGTMAADIRPMVRLNVAVVLADGDRMESGSYGSGGRVTFDGLMEQGAWKHAIDEAYRQAKVNLVSEDAPAGEMPVVLGPGWPGVLLHEAIGHGLEGDFNRKGTSAFSELMGKQVASKGVTVVDDGTLPDRRGSITIDDEGTPSSRTVLIEDGVLTGYIYDRLNARLMGAKPTGNGRRQSHAHAPMPRMTNTYMLGGQTDPKDMIAGIDRGLFAVNFGGGQVDITSGKFVFSCTEAYRIDNGKLGAPVKGATLIGNGPDVLTRVGAVGNDMELDPGIGTCGKDGQGVPVGVGQPSLLIDRLTVGGTNV